MKALIVDDEQQSREALQLLLQQFCPEVKIIGTSGNTEEALAMIQAAKPDVLFLDIDLGTHTGFDFLNMLRGYDCSVIFITAHADFALKAFEYAAVNYLLKPVDYRQLIESIHRIKQKRDAGAEKVYKQIAHLLQQAAAPSPVLIPLSDMNKTDFVHLDDIVYLESKGNYTIFHLADNSRYTKSKNLKYYEDFFFGYRRFIRLHKSYLVNKSHIKAYHKSSAEIECTGGMIIPASLGYKALLELLEEE